MAHGSGKRPEGRAADRPLEDARRKLIAFDPETWAAVDSLARDRMATIQELAEEAFKDLLDKHGRPSTLKEALKRSARLAPANDAADARPARNRR
jgi:hypothetical protein